MQTLAIFQKIGSAMQIAVIEYSRDVANIPDANSGEFDEQCKNRVIDFMPGQSEDIDKGGTLRLGAYPCVIEPGTTMERCYRYAADYRTPSTSLRVQQRLSGETYCLWADPEWHFTQWKAGGDCGAVRPLILCRRSVSPRVQKPPQQATPPLQRLYRGCC